MSVRSRATATATATATWLGNALTCAICAQGGHGAANEAAARAELPPHACQRCPPRRRPRHFVTFRLLLLLLLFLLFLFFLRVAPQVHVIVLFIVAVVRRVVVVVMLVYALAAQLDLLAIRANFGDFR